MAKFVFIFRGGSVISQSEEDRQNVMLAWQEWFDSIGEAVIEHGNPFGNAKTVMPNGEVSDGASNATGYSIIRSDNLDGAVGYAKLCPQLQAGGSIEIYETFTVM